LVQHSTPLSLSVIDYNSLCMIFSFVVGVQSANELCWIMFPGVGGRVVCGAWHSPFGSADLRR
jgi:hypothetical protein